LVQPWRIAATRPGDAVLGDGRRHGNRCQRLAHAQCVGFDTAENDAVHLVDAIVKSQLAADGILPQVECRG
jgi:hypothetical protein